MEPAAGGQPNWFFFGLEFLVVVSLALNVAILVRLRLAHPHAGDRVAHHGHGHARTRHQRLAGLREYGEVAAGNPLTIYPDAIDTIELPTIARMPKDSFLLRVKGDSLKDAYIFSGDIVIVNPNLEPKNGQIVVSILDDAAVVKRFYKRRSEIELVSENPDYKPIVIDKKYPSFKIVGIVVGIYRSMEKRAV